MTLNSNSSEIELKINEENYVAQNYIDVKNEFRDMTYAFWILFAMNFLWLLFIFSLDDSSFLGTSIFTSIVDIVTTVAWVVFAIYMNKGHIWAYVAGSFTFLFTLIVYAFEHLMVISFVDLFAIASILVRILILVYFATKIKQALIAMSISNREFEKEVLESL